MSVLVEVCWGRHLAWSLPFALCMLCLGAGCNTIDEDLLNPLPSGLGGSSVSGVGGSGGAGGGAGGTGGASSAGGSGGTVGGGGTGGSGGSMDAGMPDAASCYPNPDTSNEVCTEICPELCNDEDDDCDRRIDEDPARLECSLDNATASCNRGTCEISSCETGFFNCDGDDATGCEVDLTSDPMYCGDCNTDCSDELSNTMETACESGQCIISTCAVGFANCDDDDATGCETSIYDVDNCGGCAGEAEHEVCTGLSNVTTSSCPTGSCQIDACDSGWDDCDGLASDGCEHDLGTSVCNPLRKRITIDASFVDAPLTDFPVLVRISGDADLTMSLADGSDLYFTAESDGSTPLPFAIAAWDQSAGDLTAWVKVPSVSDSADTSFYLGYGDGIDHSGANTPANVWDGDFESVQHFDGDIVDATGKITMPMDNGTTAEPAGNILGARSFSPNDYIDMGTNALPDEQYYTLSAWVKVAVGGGDSNCKYVMDASESSGAFNGSAFGVQRDNGAVCTYVGGAWRSSGSDFASGDAWTLVVVRQDIRNDNSGSVQSSINGQPFEPLFSGNTWDSRNLATSPFQVGRWSGGSNFHFDGLIDELRVSSTSRANAWIHAEYENQRSGSTFLTVSDP